MLTQNRELIHGLFPQEIDLGNEPAYRRAQILEWLYRHRTRDFSQMKNLPVPLRTRLAEKYSAEHLPCVREQGSADTTRKFLWQLPTGDYVESVLIPASPGADGRRADRRTLCVSSQVGCAYGCRFCASGLDGWKRHLSAAEIVLQVLSAQSISGQRVDHIVFMGMGEPLANLDNVLKAITILNAPWGMGIAARNITVSTSGLVKKISELARQPLQIELAISLHGPDNETREKIMPINKKHPVEELIAACRDYQAHKKRRITFEYILIEDINSSQEHARRLARLIRGIDAKVNLIPYNTVPGLEWKRPNDDVCKKFAKILREHSITCTIRLEKGHDIAAACGQLRLQKFLDEKQPNAPYALKAPAKSTDPPPVGAPALV